jgi:hypothetical protein
MYWYVPVRTGMYAYIVHTSTYFSRYHDSYGGTYQYVPVLTSIEKLPKVRTARSTYFFKFVSVTPAVQGGTRRYKAVQEKFYCGIWQYILHSSFYPGLWRYKAVQGGTSSGFLPNNDIGVYAPISVYFDIDTDIGADFNDTRYPISGKRRYLCTPISA